MSKAEKLIDRIRTTLDYVEEDQAQLTREQVRELYVMNRKLDQMHMDLHLLVYGPPK